MYLITCPFTKAPGNKTFTWYSRISSWPARMKWRVGWLVGCWLAAGGTRDPWRENYTCLPFVTVLLFFLYKARSSKLYSKVQTDAFSDWGKEFVHHPCSPKKKNENKNKSTARLPYVDSLPKSHLWFNLKDKIRNFLQANMIWACGNQIEMSYFLDVPRPFLPYSALKKIEQLNDSNFQPGKCFFLFNNTKFRIYTQNYIFALHLCLFFCSWAVL